MSPELAAFFDRLDDAKAHEAKPVTSIEDLEAGSDDARETADVWAERLGLEGVDLAQAAFERVEHIPGQVVALAINSAGEMSAVEAIHLALRDAYAWGFLAGGLWEQARHMPDLDAEGPGDR